MKKHKSKVMDITESDSLYSDLDRMGTRELLFSIHQEDQKVALSVSSSLENIEKFVDLALQQMRIGGRLFYIGAGTSGRLGVLDASECPPTFGVDADRIIGIIAGGDQALRVAREGAEDDLDLAWQDLMSYRITEQDIVLGIASSGKTPYVLGGLRRCKEMGIRTGALVCNRDSPIGAVADIAIEVIVGPEFISGSTRMKSGTAQKMVLNMISTSLMIQLGKVRGNKMVDMKLSNAKLKERAIKMLVDELDISIPEAAALLVEHDSVRAAIDHVKGNTSRGVI
jgi:N-acetylmuramic acid 6-phosphate etherase